MDGLVPYPGIMTTPYLSFLSFYRGKPTSSGIEESGWSRSINHEIDLILSLARSFFLSITPASPFPLSPGTDRLEYSQVKKKKIYILILFLGGILRIGKRCGFLCSDSKRRAKHIPVGPSSFFHEGQSEEDGLKPMAFLYSKSITKGDWDHPVVTG
ncbi:hypothetical protein ACJX0J_003374 (mitochondrion) [Zea mays]